MKNNAIFGYVGVLFFLIASILLGSADWKIAAGLSALGISVICFWRCIRKNS
jgi:hypothetical protein